MTYEELGNEELVRGLARAAYEDLGDGVEEAFEAELLRRLSAGNPQAEKVAELEQKVCDFQAAAMIDVGGQGGPCLVEPHHVEEHVTALRARIAELERAGGFDGSVGPQPERSDGRIQGELCVCGETKTARGDVHCSGDCDDAFHNEPGGCHRYNPPHGT